MKLNYEPKQIYDVSKGQELFKKALKYVPAGIYGHLGPSEGCMIPVSAYPLFMSRAQGTYIWDLNGNRYIDYMCAYGPNFLGVLRQERRRYDRVRSYDCPCLHQP